VTAYPQPLVPVADRKFSKTRALYFNALRSAASFVASSLARPEKRAREKERFTVRPPLRRTRTRRKRSYPDRFATISNVEDINLVYIVASPLAENASRWLSGPGQPLSRLCECHRRGFALRPQGQSTSRNLVLFRHTRVHQREDNHCRRTRARCAERASSTTSSRGVSGTLPPPFGADAHGKLSDAPPTIATAPDGE